MQHIYNLSSSQNRRTKMILSMTIILLSSNQTFADDAISKHYVPARSMLIISTSAIASSVTNVMQIKNFFKQIKPVSDNELEQIALKLLSFPDDIDIQSLSLRLNLASQNYLACVGKLINAKQDATGATAQYNKLAHLSEMVSSLAKISDGFKRIELKDDMERIRGLVKLCLWLKDLRDRISSFPKTEDAIFDQLVDSEKAVIQVAILNIPSAIMEYVRILDSHGSSEITNLVNGKAEVSFADSAQLLWQLSHDFTQIRTVAGSILTAEQKKNLDRSAQRFLAGKQLAEIMGVK